ncbi:MAG TPA: fatty acid desaturase, partial [Myxococcaceae bacterium]|nr:fatty acid desaturase [Myxococcaceae bacterium]
MTYLATGAGLAWGCAHLIRQSPQVGWWLYPATVFLISTRFRAVGNMLHEACHGILVRGGKGRNARFGRILAVLDFTQFESYSREHFTHHRHLGDPHRDLDFAPRRRFGFGEPTPRFAWVHYLRPLTLFHVPTFLRPVLWSRRDPLGVRLARLGYAAALLCLAAWAGWVPFALFYLVPYLTGYQVIRYWS